MATSEVALTDQYRRAQALISAVLVRDLVRLLKAMFNPADPGPSWAVTRMAVATLVRDRRRQSADLAARHYPRLRVAAGVHTPFATALPLDLVDERLMTNIDVTGIGMYRRALNTGATPAQALDRSAVTLSGTASRLALEGGRSVVTETAQSDADALGWMRVTDGDPCSWCAMLASRGAVYKSAASAGGRKNAEFAGEGQFKFHDHCGCTITAVWSEDDPRLDHADALYDQWVQATQGHSGRSAVNAWRRHWENRGQTGS